MSQGQVVLERELTRKQLGWTHGPFEIPQEAYDQYRQAVERGASQEADWNQALAAYRSKYPTEAAEFERMLRGELPEGWDKDLPTAGPEEKGLATRKHSQICLGALGPNLPELIGGSADLTHSNYTDIKGETGSYQPETPEKRYLHFGVREHAMAAILNGIAYHDSGLIPYGGTFLVFADYMRGSMRLSALSELGVIYVLTHDSIGVGEDGPTHQPIETIPSLRAMPGMLVFRPGDANETSGAYKLAIENRHRPSALCLSRQGMANQANSSIDKVAKGGYVLEDCDGTPELILIGTGTELDLCVQAAKQLTADGKKVRVVSMPCVELFDEQSDAYKEEVLPNAVRKRIVVEAAESFGWHRFVGLDGDSVTMNRFGAMEKEQAQLAKVLENEARERQRDFDPVTFGSLYRDQALRWLAKTRLASLKERRNLSEAFLKHLEDQGTVTLSTQEHFWKTLLLKEFVEIEKDANFNQDQIQPTPDYVSANLVSIAWKTQPLEHLRDLKLAELRRAQRLRHGLSAAEHPWRKCDGAHAVDVERFAHLLEAAVAHGRAVRSRCGFVGCLASWRALAARCR